MILAVLGVIVTILILLNRLADSGIDIGWLNPFSFFRRRAWKKQLVGNPLFTLTDPLDVAVVLATSVAKIDGEISKEEKVALISLFQTEFKRSEKEASELLIFGIHLFNDGSDAISKPEKIMNKSLKNFNEEQAQSVINLLHEIKNTSELNTDEKEQYISRITKEFNSHFKPNQKW